MHGINGILTQGKSENNQLDEAPTEEKTNLSVKRKSFTHVDIDISPYHQL